MTTLYAELFLFFHIVHEHGYISNTYCLISFIFFIHMYYQIPFGKEERTNVSYAML